MKGTSKNRTAPGAQKRHPVWPTTAQMLRQLGVILLVVVVWAGLLVGYLSLTGESKVPAAEPPQPTGLPGTAAVSFSKDVLPLFRTHCERCHGDGRAQAGLKLVSYADVMAGSTRGPVVIPGSSATSRLVDLIVTGQMPVGGPKMPESEIEIIRAWVDAGALDD
jgi:mono/diheme cytochrome c family protein